MILKYEAPYEIKAQLQGDVGLDIKSIEDVVLRPGETRIVKTGLRVVTVPAMRTKSGDLKMKR